MFLCRVVMGCYQSTADQKQEYRECEQIAGEREGLYYHGLLAETPMKLKFREFIQYHQERIYPEYLLEYTWVV